jgi:hypothetical protein
MEAIKMKALLFWKDCGRFKPSQDAYWVECPAHQIEKLIQPLLKYDRQWAEKKEHYLSSEFATSNPALGLEPDCYYFLVSSDGKKIIPTEPYYPFSGQWNAYCPFEEIEPFSFETLGDFLSRFA